MSDMTKVTLPLGRVPAREPGSPSAAVPATAASYALRRASRRPKPRRDDGALLTDGVEIRCPNGRQGRWWGMTSQPSYEQSKQVAEASRETEWTKPSFGKQLFLGNLRLDLIHPQPDLDPASVEKGEAFLGRLRGFLVERVDRRQIERDAKIPQDVIEGL